MKRPRQQPRTYILRRPYGVMVKIVWNKTEYFMPLAEWEQWQQERRPPPAPAAGGTGDQWLA